MQFGILAACPPLPNTAVGGTVARLLLLGLVAVVLALVLAWRPGDRRRLLLLLLCAPALAGAPGAASSARAAAACQDRTPPAATAQVAAVSTTATTFKAGGAEPNVAVSPSGRTVLVSGLGGTSPANLYRSTDYGNTFKAIHPAFSSSGGGDWDMRFLDETTIVAADLSLNSGIYVHRSVDDGDHWTTTKVQEDVYDRPWIDHFGKDKVYLITKGFDSLPYLYESSDGGQSFGAVPVPIFLYGIPTNGGPDPVTGTLTNQNAYVDHLTVDARTGDVYVLYGIDSPLTYGTTEPEGAANNLYVAHLENGLMISHQVHAGQSDESFLSGFNWMTVDQAGTLYVMANGRIGGRWSTRLSYSKDGAKTWSPLADVGRPGNSNVYGSIAGAGVGQLALAYIRGSNTDPSTAQEWYADTATITAAGTATPTVQVNRASEKPIHKKDICFDGILCGLPGFGNDRTLLDYIWDAVSPDGTRYSVYTSDGPATHSSGGADVILFRQTDSTPLGRGVQS